MSLNLPISAMYGAEWNILDASGCRVAQCGYDGDPEKSGPLIAKAIVQRVADATRAEEENKNIRNAIANERQSLQECINRLARDVRNCPLCDSLDDDMRPFIEAIVNKARETAAAGYQQQLQSVQEVASAHQSRQGVYSGGNVAKQIEDVLRRYHDLARDSLVQSKGFRDDVLHWLRAVGLIAESVANAATHSEKNARLRGLVELVESAIHKLREARFELEHTWHQYDVFRCDYPVRTYLDRIHELEAELAAVRGEKAGKQQEP